MKKVERLAQWVRWLTTAESLLIPAVAPALIWAITNEQAIRGSDGFTSDVDWGEYAREGGWWASGTFLTMWVALIVVFVLRRWVLSKLDTSGTSRVARGVDRELRERLLRLMLVASPVLYVLSFAWYSSAFWQLLSLAVGIRLSWEWRQVESEGSARVDRLLGKAKRAAEIAEHEAMWGAPPDEGSTTSLLVLYVSDLDHSRTVRSCIHLTLGSKGDGAEALHYGAECSFTVDSLPAMMNHLRALDYEDIHVVTPVDQDGSTVKLCGGRSGISADA